VISIGLGGHTITLAGVDGASLPAGSIVLA